MGWMGSTLSLKDLVNWMKDVQGYWMVMERAVPPLNGPLLPLCICMGIPQTPIRCKGLPNYGLWLLVGDWTEK